MILTRSTWSKILVLTIAAVGFVLLYEATVLDSKDTSASAPWLDVAAPPTAGARLLFRATAYCKGTTTASGVNVRSGIVAADPSILPVGSVVQVDAPGTRYDGVYTVMDTGPAVQGRTLDLYMWSCHEALRFGRVPVRVQILRLGWSPANSAPASE